VIRKTIFWLHLVSGVAVGLVVAMMSITGVLLTYEQQLVAWADAKSWPEPQQGSERMKVDDIIASASAAGVNTSRITWYSEVNAPVLAGGGRRAPSTYIDAYNGADLGRSKNAMRRAMQSLTAWHRWFAATGDSRLTARMITGISNLTFLFLIVSGAYLWLPKIFRWPQLRQRLRFAKQYRNWKERDFYWHHVFAAWSIVPLIVIVTTAVVISFPWAGKILTDFAGDGTGRPVETDVAPVSADADRLSLDELLARARSESDGWQSIALTIPRENSEVVSFEVNKGSGRQPYKLNTLVLNAYTGEVVDTGRFSDRAPAFRARFWNRFLHTGESFGVIGQTVAGLATLASLFLVWTGFALAWRRLIMPLYRRR